MRARVGIGNPNDVVLVRDVYGRITRMPLEELPPSAASAWQLGGVQTARALIVTAAERNEMNAQVLQFRTDVDAAEALESSGRATRYSQIIGMAGCRIADLAWDCQTMKCVNTPDPLEETYRCVPGVSFTARDFRTNQLTPFLLDWEGNLTGGSAIGVINFEQLKARFHSLVADWKALGFSTSAVPPPVKPPGDLLETTAAWLPWVLGGAEVLAAGWFLLPVLAPAAAAAMGGRR